MNRMKKIISLLLAVSMICGSIVMLASCNNNNGASIDNESTRLVLSTSELDGVFNPFYYSSGPDGSVVGLTQIGMLSSDKDGKVAYGKDEACVVLDYEAVPVGDTTRYRFVLKNDLKFSNGSPLTMRDVLFNLYVYLDPAYYGSATIYSTDIVGLKQYRTQTANEDEQESFTEQFDALASDRIQRLLDCIERVYDNHPIDGSTDDNIHESISEEVMIAELTVAMNDLRDFTGEENYVTVVDDYKLAEKYFREELKTDYTYAKGTAEDIKYTDKNGKEVTLTTDTEAFLFNAQLIKWDEDNRVFDYSLDESCKNWTEEQAINTVFTMYFPNKVDNVITGWNTANKLLTYFSFLEQQKHFATTDRIAKNISGIRYANQKESVTVNGVEYGVPTLDANGAVTNDTHEVLEITIHKVDPKAIWNFAFTVAPMYYYSDQAHIEAFDYESNFGVEFGSIEFMDNVIKDPDKIGVPVGAGPYKATTRSGDSSNVTAGTFKADNVVYFERNEHFLFDVKIKYVNYQVVATNLMLDALYSGDVHFVEPACKQENIDSIESKKSEGFAHNAVMTNGYGYIGINAEKVPNLYVRQAIMHAINTQYAVDYYFGYSHPITRPMTKASWAYPDAADEAGQVYAFDETGAMSEYLVKEVAGYTTNADGIYWNGDDDICSYTFTIAGDSTDHPAYQSLKRAAEILNQHGFKITVETDINALKKLNNGDLTVWAAAWSASVDPDMYQVYHIDSTAGSTANWGYRAIRKNAGGKYDTELEIVTELSEIIDLARETLEEGRRSEYYAEALDLVMDLAVELPTYQRSDLFAYNTNIIDADTLTPLSELTPYNGPMSKIWTIGLNETDGADAGNNGIIIIIIIAALVVVGGAGVGVFFVLKNKKAKETAKAKTAPVEQPVSKEEPISKEEPVSKEEPPKTDEAGND